MGKRTRRDPDDAKALILDCAERVMLEDGYAAVSSRRVAKEAGLAPALIHYYYPTTDDLFIALHRRFTDGHANELANVLQSEDPLPGLWRFQTDRQRAALGVEFLALANHRSTIRQEITRQSEGARNAQAEAIASRLKSPLPDGTPLSALGLVTVLHGAARMLVNEEGIGITEGHAEARELIEWILKALAGNHPNS